MIVAPDEWDILSRRDKERYTLGGIVPTTQNEVVRIEAYAGPNEFICSRPTRPSAYGWTLANTSPLHMGIIDQRLPDSALVNYRGHAYLCSIHPTRQWCRFANRSIMKATPVFNHPSISRPRALTNPADHPLAMQQLFFPSYPTMKQSVADLSRKPNHSVAISKEVFVAKHAKSLYVGYLDNIVGEYKDGEVHLHPHVSFLKDIIMEAITRD